MANSLVYKEKTFKVGDTISIEYKIKEGDKERVQTFKGILTKIKGDSTETRMFTVRRITKDGIGVERILPFSSPYINEIKLIKQSSYQKSKAYFLRDLSEQELRNKLYRTKTKKTSKKKLS